MSATITVPAGTGYFDLTVYPIGGDFKRFKTDTQVTLTREFDSPCNGCSHEGLTLDGKRVAVNARRLAEVPA